MISATSWVPRGFAAEFPVKYDLDEEEMDRISKLAKLQLDEAKEELEAKSSANKLGNGAQEKDEDDK